MNNYRSVTRKQRYSTKRGITLPFELVTINFLFDDNLGYLTRAAACFGIPKIHVIGTTTTTDKLKRCSGSTEHLVERVYYPNVQAYLSAFSDSSRKLISLELSEEFVYKDLDQVDFSSLDNAHIVVGNETTGVPYELLLKSDEIARIPMPGKGYCLNTAQTGNIVMYEIVRQMRASNKILDYWNNDYGV